MQTELQQPLLTDPRNEKQYLPALLLMICLYFGVGFITAMNDVLVPHFKDLFQLTNVQALFVQFAFFGAYFLLSIPSGAILARLGYRRGIITALVIVGIGLLIFLPASSVVAYSLFLGALFVVGAGFALLQVAMNSYLGALGRPDRAASRLNLAGAFNSVAGTLAPWIGGLFLFRHSLHTATRTSLAHSVRPPYVVLAGLAFLLAVAVAFFRLPKLSIESSGTQVDRTNVWRIPQVQLGAVAIFVYVGVEVAIGSLLIGYLSQPEMGSIPHLEAARYVSLYWGCAMLGRFIGFVALRHLPQARALGAVAVLGSLSILVAANTLGAPGIWSLVICGLFNSIMWPCIFPLSLQGLGTATTKASGVLVTMVVGGAIVPELQGLLADHVGYHASFLILLACYLYIGFFAFTRGRSNLREQEPPAVVI